MSCLFKYNIIVIQGLPLSQTASLFIIKLTSYIYLFPFDFLVHCIDLIKNILLGSANRKRLLFCLLHTILNIFMGETYNVQAAIKAGKS